MQRRFPIDDVLLRLEVFAIKSRAKLCEILMFWAAKFWGEWATQISDRIFITSGSPSNMWQSLVTIGQATSEIRRRKKERKKI